MLLYWIWFAQLNKITALQKQTLLRHFADPEEIYHNDGSLVRQIEELPESVAEALEDKDLTQAQQIMQECADKGIGIITLGDSNYPHRLRNTADPPLVLYFKGQLPMWDLQPVVGIVGTRKASPYGLNTAGRFGKQIAACGALVVSGGAVGIDTMAMKGALEAGRPVVGVLGCGVDVVYPAQNRQLFEQVVQNGCLISEYPPRTKGLAWHFPERNRIITGISNGLLVVEAPERSGAMISARHAMEQGRDVFAVPGNVDVESCAGSNALLQDQAIPALSGWDVVKEYAGRWPGVVSKQVVFYDKTPETMVAQTVEVPAQPKIDKPHADKKAIDKEEKSTYSVELEKKRAALSEDERTVLALIGREPLSVDEVIAGADMSASTVKGILTRLMIKGMTVNHPGGRVSLK